MPNDDSLMIAKRKLDHSLGDNFKTYLQLVRSWFTSQLTKEEFDHRARQFLPSESVSCHNEFLLALFNKCTSLAPPKEPNVVTSGHVSAVNTSQLTSDKVSHDTSVDPKMSKAKKLPSKTLIKSRIKTLKASFDRRFEPVSVYDNSVLSQTTKFKSMDDTTKLLRVSSGYCVRESSLPDYFMSHLRMFVLVWEMGLDAIDDNAVKIVITALRDFMKSILTSIFANRSSYRIRDRRFKYAIGAPPVNPYLKNSSTLLSQNDHQMITFNTESGDYQPVNRPTIDWAQNDAMYSMACGTSLSVKRSRGEHDDGPVTLWHLLHTFKSNPNVIPVHFIYSINLERIICKLWHQTDDETSSAVMIYK